MSVLKPTLKHRYPKRINKTSPPIKNTMLSMIFFNREERTEPTTNGFSLLSGKCIPPSWTPWRRDVVSTYRAFYFLSQHL